MDPFGMSESNCFMRDLSSFFAACTVVAVAMMVMKATTNPNTDSFVEI